MPALLTLKNYINGTWVPAHSGKVFNSENPANTKDIVAKVPRSDARDINEAVKAADAAFESWRLFPAPKRGEILFHAAELIEQRKSKLGDLVCREMGKVKKESYGDVQEAIDMGYYMAGEGRRMFGQTVPSELPNKSIRTIREPVGVFGLITPWNFPTAIPAWKLFPALVCGNTVVFKPSQYTSACAQGLVECFVDAGIPKGVLNLVHGMGSEAGDALIHHPKLHGISFTGSSKVGKLIASACAECLIKNSLEMGGKNVIVVMDDADIDLAIDGTIWAAFGTTGQRCTATSRVVVHQKMAKEFTDKLIRAVKKLHLGDGMKKDTDVGPLINKDAVDKCEYYMNVARVDDKVTVASGGRKATGRGLEHGYFFEPTVLTNVKSHHRVAQEEIFGPIVSILEAKDFDEAIKIANDVHYGLSSSIFTQDVNNAERAARDLQTGLVYINASTIGAEIQVPFGGLKDTGNGHREAGGMGGALETYTEIKVINCDYSGRIQKAQGIE